MRLRGSPREILQVVQERGYGRRFSIKTRSLERKKMQCSSTEIIRRMQEIYLEKKPLIMGISRWHQEKSYFNNVFSRNLSKNPIPIYRTNLIMSHLSLVYGRVA